MLTLPNIQSARIVPCIHRPKRPAVRIARGFQKNALLGEFSMTVEQNNALMRRFYEEVWGKGHLDVAAEVFAADYVRHDLRPGNPLSEPEGQKKIAADF